MKPVKFALACAGLIGVIAIFLSYVESLSFWDLRSVAAAQVYLALVGFAGGLAMGGLAVARGALSRWQAVIATLCFSLAILPAGVREGMKAEVGGKLMLLAAIAGLAIAIAGIVRPDAPRRTA